MTQHKSAVLISLFAASALLTSTANVSARQTPPNTLHPITLWTKFNDQSPQNTQDQWLADFLKAYTSKTGNQVTNIFQPFDQINSKLNIAVQAGGDVPDVSYVDSQNIPFLSKNGDLIDLTDYVRKAAWYTDLDKVALASCTAPDGKIYCVPTSVSGETVYYWTSDFPSGFPATAQDLLAMAKGFKAANPTKFIVTLKGSEEIAFQQTWFPLIISAGGTISDPATGQATWANDKTVAVVQWARDLFANGYAPQVDLATGFDDETPFTKSDAASFLAGSWSYVYLTPLQAPDGTVFSKDAGSVQAAFDAGKLSFSTPLAWQGGKPVSMITGTGYAIPTGAQNIAAAQAMIDYAMQTKLNADYAVAYGALPALTSALTDARLNTGYWKAVSDNQTKYSQGAPVLADYDKGITALTGAINKAVSDPTVDIMQTLKAAQDNYNAGLK